MQVSGSTGQVGAEVAGIRHGESPGPGGWRGRGGEPAGRAQGQAKLPLPGELVAGASPPDVFRPDKPHLRTIGKGKIRITWQNKTVFPSSPPTFLGGGSRGRGVRKLKPREGIAGTQTRTPGSRSSAFSAPFGFIPQDQELRGRGSVVTGGKRPDPPLISLIFSVHLTRVW